MNQSRFSSPVTLAAIIAQLVSLLIILDVIDIGVGDAINAAAAAFLQLLIAFGVLNNPTDKAHF